MVCLWFKSQSTFGLGLLSFLDQKSRGLMRTFSSPTCNQFYRCTWRVYFIRKNSD
ncbi:hypothetical protein Hanom_Chr07g00635161 [Helianthus anomalus]